MELSPRPDFTKDQWLSWALEFTGMETWIRTSPSRRIEAFAMLDDLRGIQLFGEPLEGCNGIYFPHRRVLVVRRSRTADSYGMALDDPDLPSLSAAGATECDAIARTLVHELGHHLNQFLGELREDAIASFREAQRLSERGEEERFLSTWASTSEDEYFAEVWTAWFFEPARLEVLDPRAYRLIEKVLETLRP